MQKTWYRFKQVIVGKDTILATPNHPFYLPDLQRYIPADSLQSGMRLLTLAGALTIVTQVAAVDTTLPIYNFEVAEQHNYFVGREGVLVHNTDGKHCIFKKATVEELIEEWSPEQRELLANDLTKFESLTVWFQNKEIPELHKVAFLTAWDILRKGTTEPLKSNYIPFLNNLADDLLDPTLTGLGDFLSLVSKHDFDRLNAYVWEWDFRKFNKTEKTNFDRVKSFADGLKKNPELEAFLGQNKRENYLAWDILDYLKNNHRTDKGLDLLKKVANKLEQNPGLFLEMINPAKKDLYYKAFNYLVIDDTQWWYKYRLLRQHYVSDDARNSIILDPNFKDFVARQIPYTVTTKGNESAELGKLFEDDLLPRIGAGINDGFKFLNQFLPSDLAAQLKLDVWDKGYRIMVTQVVADISDHYPKQNQPRMDMLFLKLDQSGNIDYNDALYFDIKLSYLYLDSGAQRNLSDLSGASKKITLQVDEGFSPIIYQIGSKFTFNDHIKGKPITLKNTNLIGTTFDSKNESILRINKIK